MTEKPKETPKEELECPKKYIYDTGIIFECKDNSKVEIIGEDVVDLLNELATKCSKLEKENEQLKEELHQQEVSEQRRREYDDFWKEKINKVKKNDK